MPDNIWKVLDQSYAEEPSLERQSAERIRSAVLAHAQWDLSRKSEVRRGVWIGRVALVAASIVVVSLGVKYGPMTLDKSADGKAYKVYQTNAGQRATITLADGSTMLLAPASHARVIGRKVDLTGEALFTVTARSKEPFTVVANGIATRVLGTSFTVRKYDSDKEVQVIVAEGRVSVANTVLTVGDAASAASNSSVAVEHEINIAAALAWTTGRLNFDKIALRDAIPALERWYGVDVQVNDENLLDRRITTSFQKESSAQAMRILAELVHARMESDGAVVRFSSNNK